MTRVGRKLRVRTSIAAALALVAIRPSAQHGDDILDRSKHVLRSAIEVNLTNHSVKLPLYHGRENGRTVWYVLTDVSDAGLANQLGLNFAPKLANASRGCPGCVQDLHITRN